MEHRIPQGAISRYSAAPGPPTVQSVSSLHTNIRSVLGSNYDTFLQGSYKNDTGIADINDVDIVALRRGTISSHFNGTIPTHPITWREIFAEVEHKLEASHHYRGKVNRGDKCIKVETGFHADVVPAIQISSDGQDPIAVYSFRQYSERKNFPRRHYENGVEKHRRTGQSYKPAVRMFKRWARNWFAGTSVAPSFYVECLVHSIPDENFMWDGAVTFFLLADYITSNVSRHSVVYSVAGDKDIITEQEWAPAQFEEFSARLQEAVSRVVGALRATSAVEADKLWREAFNE